MGAGVQLGSPELFTPMKLFTPELFTPPPPQDVYTGVCALVRKRVEADAAAGVPEASSLLRVTTGGSGLARPWC